FVKDGFGKLILGAANNTFGGEAQVAEGTLTIQTGTALGATTGQTTVLGGATLELQPATVFTVGNERLNLVGNTPAGPATLRNVTGNNTWAGPIALAGRNVINVDRGPFTVSDSINNLTFGAGLLTKEGLGTLTLSGPTPNGYTGTTVVNAGTLA